MAKAQIGAKTPSIDEQIKEAEQNEASEQEKVSATLSTALRAITAGEMAEAASQRLELAIDAVEAILRDSDAKDSDKLAAAAFIRDTAHGKPGQAITMSGNLNVVTVNANIEFVKQHVVIEDQSTNGNAIEVIDNKG